MANDDSTQQDALELAPGDISPAKRRTRRNDDDQVVIGQPSDDEDAVIEARQEERGPKLSKGQRAILLRLIGQYWDTTIVAEVLAEEYPDFPEITGDTIRYHRRKIDKKAADLLAQAEAEALSTGLARKSVRVMNLTRMFNRWAQIPFADTAETLAADGSKKTKITAVRRDVSAEMREIIKQIGQEMGTGSAAGSPPPGSPAVGAGNVPGSTGSTPAPNPETQERKLTLAELLSQIQARRDATTTALAAAPAVPTQEDQQA